MADVVEDNVLVATFDITLAMRAEISPFELLPPTGVPIGLSLDGRPFLTQVLGARFTDEAAVRLDGGDLRYRLEVSALARFIQIALLGYLGGRDGVEPLSDYLRRTLGANVPFSVELQTVDIGSAKGKKVGLYVVLGALAAGAELLNNAPGAYHNVETYAPLVWEAFHDYLAQANEVEISGFTIEVDDKGPTKEEFTARAILADRRRRKDGLPE